jgi:hypothetical protein
MEQTNPKIKCLYCAKLFSNENGRWMHSKAKHPGRKNPKPKRAMEDESYASRIISAREDAAAGRTVDADLELMLHDEIYGG